MELRDLKERAGADRLSIKADLELVRFEARCPRGEKRTVIVDMTTWFDRGTEAVRRAVADLIRAVLCHPRRLA